ncbi:putative F-box/kelch-repeat protein KMD1/2 [Dioscorea sansibarensis]
MDGYDAKQALIPGLPEDIALDCLARVPHRFHQGLRPVCRRWCQLVKSPEFYLHRERIGTAEDVIFLVQAQPAEKVEGGVDRVTSRESKAEFRLPTCALVAYNVTVDVWGRVRGEVPVFARVAAAGGKVVVMGGWDPESLEPMREVGVVDPVTGRRRVGKAMPTVRSFFAAASMGGSVFVAGGHDSQKNALRTAEAYDVEMDDWVELPAMEEERDECQGAVVGGKFWAVSGYRTEGQGRFDPTAECYDPETEGWIKVEGIWEEGGGAPSSAFFAAAEGERLGYVDGRGAREYEKGWKGAAAGPEGMRTVAVAAAAGESVFAMGTEVEGRGHAGWVLENGKWRGVRMPDGFYGSVYSATAIRV